MLIYDKYVGTEYSIHCNFVYDFYGYIEKKYLLILCKTLNNSDLVVLTSSHQNALYFDVYFSVY